ncbi:uncharacterized protein LOC143297334 [Babylonia areolata]|uniref:uncharacterized protein LOC143297334 n=1 Tax=Babylonia areolata TaxID=304850 RepID=UPI003FD63957
MTSHDPSCPQRATGKFLEEKVLKTHQELREAVPPPGQQEEVKAQRLKEFQLQAFLRLELESLCNGVEQIDPAEREGSRDQIVQLLRSLLFGLGPKPVLTFLNTTVLDNYGESLAPFLVSVYDDLMQPLPRALRGGRTPQSDPGQDPPSPGAQSSLGGDDASQPSLSVASSDRSATSPRRTRSSTHPHPVLPRISSQRQIEVKVKAPPSKKPKESKGKKGSKSKSRREKSKSPAKHKGGKKARRNLFDTDLCKEPSPKDAHKSTRKKRPSGSSKHKPSQKTFVAETPRHRQRGRASWQQEQEEAEPEGDSGAQEVKVIHESPFKDMEAHKTTPGRYKAPRRVLRRSFYSSGSANMSRSLSRALENPDNISGRHHVAHLEDYKGGQLAKALSMEGEGSESPRRRITALLNPPSRPSHQGASPDFHSPARNTRSSRSPGPSSSRQRHLLADSRSMPAFTSAAKILDFSSPVKSSGVRSQTLATPPRAGRERRTLLVAATPSPKKGPPAGRTTPTKGRGGAGQPRTPTKPSTSKQGSSTASTSTKDKVVSGWGSSQKGEGPSTPRKRVGRGQEEEGKRRGVVKGGMSSHGGASTSSGSPSHRPVPQLRQHVGLFSSYSFSSDPSSPPMDLPPRPRPSYATTPTKSRPVQDSPVRTPSKLAVNIPPAFSQQFLSPVKTPTKSILKNSPMLHGSLAHRDMSSRTPTKVTFTSDPMTPTRGESGVRTLDSVSRSQRRKQRQSGEGVGEGPSSAGEGAGPHHHAQPGPSRAGLLPVVPSEGCRLDSSSQGFLSAGVTRKRSCVGASSSPHKRRRLDSSAIPGISGPALFSENAMDCDYSASNDDRVFPASSSSAPPFQPPSPPVKEQSAQRGPRQMSSSPLFRGRSPGKGTRGKKPVFDLSVKQASFESLGGSQGFEVGGLGKEEEGEPPPSPTFNTSPTVRRQRGASRHRRPSGQMGDSGTDVPSTSQGTLPSTSTHTTQRQKDSTSSPTQSCVTSGSVTPTRSAGTSMSRAGGGIPKGGKERKISPVVSTSGLTQLISSPLMLSPPAPHAAPDGEQDAIPPTPPRKRTRKKLQW